MKTQYNVLTGNNVTLQWSVTGSGFTGIVWSIKPSSTAVNIWSARPDGSYDGTVTPPAAYKDRLSSTFDGSIISLIIKDLKLTDSNNYYCTLNSLAGDVTSSKMTLNVYGKLQTSYLIELYCRSNCPINFVNESLYDVEDE